MKTKKLFVSLLFLSTAACSGLAFAWHGGAGYGQGGNGAVLDALYPQACALAPDPSAVLSDSQAATLRHMREEEKLARDLYLYFDARWGSRVFANIAASEQMHMDQILSFLQAYGLSDPATTVAGTFNDVALQQLYDQLATRGGTSLLEALRAAAYVEEVDIRDLRLAADAASDTSLQQMYLNLTSASYSHLNAVAGQIEILSATYSAQVLDAADVATILSGAGVAGVAVAGVGLNGANLAVATATCFTPSVQNGTRSYANGAVIRSTEALTVATRLSVEAALVGQVADLIVVVEYTPPNASAPMLLMRSGNDWVSWDGNRYSLAAAQRVNLAQQQQFQIFQGTLGGMPGQFNVSAGCRLTDGTLIFAASPISVTVE